MSRIISIHSFRGGTGKSNTTANVAALLATEGLRIGVVDTDIQSPGIHVLFGVDEPAGECGGLAEDSGRASAQWSRKSCRRISLASIASAQSSA